MSEIHTLSNGVRVVVDPMPSLESVALGVWVSTGSVDEREGEYGLAHLLEHMAFKGTESRTARQIAEEIETAGGYINAATSHQRTGYYVRLLKEDITLGVDILADILTNPRFDENEFRKEKEVVIQEIGEAADTPDDVVFENLMSVCWQGHPLSRPILGTPDSVRAHTTSGLRAFMRRGYQPGAMVIAVAGKVDAESFLPLAEASFGAREEVPDSNERSLAGFQGGLAHDERVIEQTHLAVAFPGVSTRDDDFYAARIMADTLGGGMSSRLFQRIREEEGLAYSVYAFSDSFDDCGLIGCYAGADKRDVPAVACAFREELEALSENVSDEEINRTRAMLRASLLMGLESPANRIEGAAGQIFRDGRIMSPRDVADRLDAVSASDVRRCAGLALAGPVAVSIVGAADTKATQQGLSA